MVRAVFALTYFVGAVVIVDVFNAIDTSHDGELQLEELEVSKHIHVYDVTIRGARKWENLCVRIMIKSFFVSCCLL